MSRLRQAWEAELAARAQTLTEHHDHVLTYSVTNEHTYTIRHITGVEVELLDGGFNSVITSSSIWCETCNGELLIEDDDGPLIQHTPDSTKVEL